MSCFKNPGATHHNACECRERAIRAEARAKALEEVAQWLDAKKAEHEAFGARRTFLGRNHHIGAAAAFGAAADCFRAIAKAAERALAKDGGE